MTYTAAIKGALAGLAITLGGISQPASADMVAVGTMNPNARAFRVQHPIRVYVAVDIDTRRGTDDIRFERTALEAFRRNLPPYVVLVADPFRSDLAIVADQRRYDLDFRTLGRDRREQPYNRHWTKGRCGRFDMAYYTTVRKQGTASARYDLDVRMRHFGTMDDRLETRTRGDYDYATRLKARTNCGMISTRHAPNRAVKDMLWRGTDDYRHTVAIGIRSDAARDLGLALAGRVRAYSNQYYDGLAYTIGTGVDIRILGGYWQFGRHDWGHAWHRKHHHDRWYDDWRTWQKRHPRSWTRHDHDRHAPHRDHRDDHDRGHKRDKDHDWNRDQGKGHDRDRDHDHDRGHPRRP